MDIQTIENLLRAGEGPKVEFKSERRGPISDREIYETIVCLANAEGGVILLSVENDGTVTGARPHQGTSIDPYRLQAAIFNNTEPPINTRISVNQIENQPVVLIEVDSYPEICATKDGRVLRRSMGAHGPECLPFYPYQYASRRSDLGLFDFSAQVFEESRWDDLNPLEFERLRQTIRRRHGDTILLSLDDQQLAQALQLIVTRGQELIPNAAGIILLGHEEALRRFIPTHEIAFQVLDTRGNVAVNDFYFGPLLKTLEIIEERFSARNTEQDDPAAGARLHPRCVSRGRQQCSPTPGLFQTGCSAYSVPS